MPVWFLPMWTVYDHPTDVPDAYIARKWLVGPGETVIWTDETITEEKLEDIQKYMISAGLTRLHRQPEDDPVIVETWL